ncbi:MAG: desulfoferrodoxin [Clostridiales bacterium]|nr:desulfoferrodoxin [Clostridiales bacterium]
MAKKQAFFTCVTCGNLVGAITITGAPLVCCGKPMKELIPNSTEAAREKHIPVVKVSGEKCTVSVGSAAHPMAEDHHIEWIYLQTERGGQRKNLKAGEAPELVFGVVGDKAVAAFAYCNLHGLWKAEL